MREKEKHKEALEYFIELFGEMDTSRTFQKIADRFGVSERTIWNWYRELNWKQRSAKRLERKRKEDEKKREKNSLQSISGNFQKNDTEIAVNFHINDT